MILTGNGTGCGAGGGSGFDRHERMVMKPVFMAVNESVIVV